MFGGRELFHILVLATIQVIAQDTNHCYACNENPYLKFGTKTAYEFVHGGNNPYKVIPHCEPIQTWMLIRHGTNYPSISEIREMQKLPEYQIKILENHEKHRGHLCAKDLENLRQWHLDPNVQLKPRINLTDQGAEELYQLGKRVRNNLPQLFPPVVADVSSANYKFRAADETRMVSDKVALMSGLLDRVDILNADFLMNDTLFAAYSNCPRWVKEVANNDKVLKELKKFRENPEYQNMIYSVSQRLGFLHNITADAARLMWNMCRYDKAWRVRDVSPWCAMFSDIELQVLEYEEDTKDYYQRGYGHEFNIRLGCPPLRHLFQSFRELESNNYSNAPKGVFNLGKSGSLHLFMAAMGFANDSEPPLASGFNLRNDRQWRTSEIGSFAANIAAVFYKCEDTRSPHKVVFYLAEKLVHYDGCEDGICDWEYLKNKFPNAVSECDTDFCFPNFSDIQSMSSR